MPAGQSVTVGAQEVIVCTWVDQIVLVTSPTGLVMYEDPAEEVGETVAVTPLDDVLPFSAPTEELDDAGTTVVEMAQLDVE